VRPISVRFFAGKSIPARRAMRISLDPCFLTLPLLMLRVNADHAHHPVAMNQLAFVAHLLD
jgi:hypothetical protein